MALNIYEYYQSIIETATYHLDNARSLIESAVLELLENYSNEGLKNADSLNFNRLELRCAYIYLYSTSHTLMVLDALTHFQEEKNVALINLLSVVSRGNEAFNITSLGGGPGSDSLGILTYLELAGFLRRGLSFTVESVDEYSGWKSAFLPVMEKYRSKKIQTNFRAQNLLEPFSSDLKNVLRRTHFLSMVKFISAISADGRGTVNCLRSVIELLQGGTLVLMIDNAGGGYFTHAVNICKSAGLVLISEKLHYNFKIANGDENGMRYPKYGKYAQRGTKISCVIFQKPPSLPLIVLGNLNNRNTGFKYEGSTLIFDRSPFRQPESPDLDPYRSDQTQLWKGITSVDSMPRTCSVTPSPRHLLPKEPSVHSKPTTVGKQAETSSKQNVVNISRSYSTVTKPKVPTQNEPRFNSFTSGTPSKTRAQAPVPSASRQGSVLSTNQYSPGMRATTAENRHGSVLSTNQYSPGMRANTAENRHGSVLSTNQYSPAMRATTPGNINRNWQTERNRSAQSGRSERRNQYSNNNNNTREYEEPCCCCVIF